MPWTRKQVNTARAVEHGWKPKGKAKGFTRKLAHEMIVETDDGKRMVRKVKLKKR